MAKSTPYSGPRVIPYHPLVIPYNPSPFPFHHPKTENKTHIFETHLPFHFLKPSSLKQTTNQKQIAPKNSTLIPAPGPGIGQNMNFCIAPDTCNPPDVQIAVGERVAGNQFAVEMVNSAIQIHEYPPTICPPNVICPPLFQSMRSFFGLPANNVDFIFDPRIFYNDSTHRFFASITDAATNSVRVAVSTSADPTGDWNIYNFPFNACPDNASIGGNGGLFAISANLYPAGMGCNGMFLGVQFHIVDVHDLIAGTSTPRYSSFPCLATSPGCTTPNTDPALGPRANSLRVVKLNGGNGLLNLVDMEQYNDKTYALIYTISDYRTLCGDHGVDCYQTACGTPPVLLLANVCAVEVHTPIPPPAGACIQYPNILPSCVLAAQPGGFRLYNGDSRIASASAGGNPYGPTGGSLWFAYNEWCDSMSNPGRSCIHLVQMRSALTQGGFGTHTFYRWQYTLHQDFQVPVIGNDAFDPALDVDRDGNMALTFGFSGPNVFPSLAVSRQDYSPGFPPPNAIQSPATAVVGTSSDTSNSAGVGPMPQCNLCSRYGDYFGVQQILLIAIGGWQVSI